MATALPWHALSLLEVAERLGVDPDRGLDEAQAQERLRRDGPNAWPPRRAPSPWAILWRQLSNFLTLLLLGAALISFGLGEPADALAILAALALNVAVGFVMDYRSERDIAAIAALSPPLARVRRDAAVRERSSEALVMGDVVLLEAGDRVPADGRVWSGTLAVDESLLSGESVPVDKQLDPLPGDALPLAERRNEVFAGSLVVRGSAVMVVTATGPSSELGRIGALLRAAERPPIPLAARIEVLGRTLVGVVVVLAAVILLLGMWQGIPFLPLLETAVVLAIAAVPEGLPSVATLALAAGSRRLARRGLRVRHLGAVEALGSLTTLCLDKTGTLTLNEMTVQEVWVPGHRLEVTGEGYAPVGSFREAGGPPGEEAQRLVAALLGAAQRCSDATLEAHGEGWHVHGDPSEGAILSAARKAGLEDERGRALRLLTLPPGPDHPWMVVVDSLSGEPTLFAKGAPEQVLERCRTIRSATGARALDAAERSEWLARNDALAARALRVFGVATRPLGPGWQDEALEAGWEWLGLVGMADPARPGVAEALAEAHRAGIKTVMITGDQPATALAIARELDLAGGQEPRVQVGGDAFSPGVTVYARATPEGKFALVQGLQASGEVVAMTGDGVNDAPALRAAVVGVAMGRGTDVAREAASVVLLDERLATLLSAIAEGRAAFLNIQKAVDFLVTCSITTMLAVLLTSAAGYPLPLLPLQILYLNLLTHAFPALGLAMEPADPGVMSRPPLPARGAILTGARLGSILWHAVIIATASLALGAWGWSHGGESHGRTMLFATLSASLLLHTFADRSPSPFGGWRLRGSGVLWPFLGWAIALFVAALLLPGLQGLLRLTPLGASDWGGVLLAAAVTAAAVEFSKIALPPASARR